ncbi:hypothetical protein ONS96_003959 [Cadophora gregata f. sp. sojae]|nr:hypothetical protein ONS96_003959 [Cadophora gregata f. sp. sojae]
MFESALRCDHYSLFSLLTRSLVHRKIYGRGFWLRGTNRRLEKSSPMNPPSVETIPAMPHVVSQWQSDQSPARDMEYRQSTKLEKATSTEFLRPVQISIRRSKRAGGVRPAPSLKFLSPREDERWEYSSGRGDWEQTAWEQSGAGRTPSSSVESVFEMYTSGPYDSPNSSTNSSFIAELEDTALVTRPSRRSAPPSSNKIVYISPSSMEFQTTELSARAVIKVVDETIAAIEDSNRKLLSRAVAAEEAAKALLEQNSQLQLKIERCTRKSRPKTAPSSPVSRTRQKRNQDPQSATPLSVFNATIDEQLVTPRPVKNRSQSAPERPPPPYPDMQTSLWTQAPLSAPAQTELMPSPFNNSSNHHSFPIQSQEQQPSTYYRRPPSLPTTPRPPQFQSQSQIQPPSNLLSPFRSPGSQAPPRPPPLLIHREIPRYETRHKLTPAASTPHLRSIRLDTQFKNKPLPPLGPMSPSVLSGLVEIGTTNRVDDGRGEVKSDGVGRRRRGLSDLFKKAKESPIWK